VFSEIIRNFGNLAALVSTNKTDLDFSRSFMNLTVQIIQKEETAISQLNDPAYEDTFFQILDKHESSKDIQELFKIISDKLGIEKRELTLIKSGSHKENSTDKGDDVSSLKQYHRIIDRFPFTSKRLGSNIADSRSFGYGN